MRSSHVTPVPLVALAGLVMLTGCGASNSGSTVDQSKYTDKTAERTVTIEARDDFFTPPDIKIRKGSTVVFENDGRNEHNVISADRAFRDIETDAFAPGKSVRVTFDETGQHDFYCSLHGTPSGGMHGSILVVP